MMAIIIKFKIILKYDGIKMIKQTRLLFITTTERMNQLWKEKH